jgi:phage tail-like protein
LKAGWRNLLTRILMADTLTEPKHRLLDLLPWIYQEGCASGDKNYLQHLLGAFEKILWGEQGQHHASIDGVAPEGLQEKIGRLSDVINPRRAEKEFLPWLAGWMALTLRPSLTLERKRELIAQMIPLYRIRGTRRYLEELFRLCLDVPAAVEEEDIPALQLGLHSTIGVDTYIEGGAPHFFRVRLLVSHLSTSEIEEQRHLAYEVVELGKPAHTGYEFLIDSPQLQIGVHSIVGIDTILGPA